MTARPTTESVLYRATLARLEERRGRRAFAAPLRDLRSRSASWFREHGFPQPKEEAWRFTPLGEVTGVPFVPATPVWDGADYAALSRARLAQSEAHCILVVGGRPATALDQIPPGVQIHSLAELAEHEPELLLPHLDRGDAPASAFAAVNDALFEDGLVVRVGAGVRVQQPLQILVASAAHGQPSVDYPRLLVLAEASSQLGLVETHVSSGTAPFLSNSVVELRVGEGARVEHTRLELGSEHSRRVGWLEVRQQRDSRYLSRVVTLGGVFSRLDLNLRFEGDRAESDLSGLYLARGREQIDHHTVVDHAQPHCTSRESYRGIVDDRARAIFDGIIYVRPGAQLTSAHQQSRNLVLSDDARVNTKPHLQIEADDVQCSHGASVGQLDDEALFYLRSRGIEQSEARALMAYGFVAESVDAIAYEPLRELVRQQVRVHLPKRAALKGQRS
jgi:Fe-S cluster assembly protein SufD